MKTKLIMLDTPIIVSDEKIKNGDAVYEDISGIFSPYGEGDVVENPRKIIAGIEGLPKINWNGLEEEFGWVDVEKLAKVDIKFHHKNIQKREIDYILGYEDGFKKAQSLNEKKFSLDKFELADLIRKSYLIHGNDSWISIAKDVIGNLSKPKVFDIEVEIEYGWDSSGNKHSRPKIVNNSIKVLRKL